MSNNNYTHWQLLDYPSMHQIAEKVRENKFNIVFSVDNKVGEVYDTLVKIIGKSARRVELINDDEAVVKVIDDVYKSIRSTVEMRIDKPEEISDNIEIKLFSYCNTSHYNETSICSFKKKPTITFDAKIKMKSCPKDKSMLNKVIKIGIQ